MVDRRSRFLNDVLFTRLPPTANATPGVPLSTIVGPAKHQEIVVKRPLENDDVMYKYVDYAHAHFLERGSIRVGTLRGYGAIEGPRRDESENTIFRDGTGKLRASDPLEREYIESSDIWKFNEKSLGSTFTNVNFETLGSDLHCVCFSTWPNCGDGFGGNQALFRIDQPKKFAERLSLVNGLSHYHIGRVEYGERFARINQSPTARPDPFLKPSKFAPEHEIRIIWDNTAGSDPKQFDGREDEELSKMLTRLR